MAAKKAKKKAAKRRPKAARNPDANPVGRPTVMTPETLGKLEDGFSKGLSDREACLYAGIDPTTLYDYLQSHPEFSNRRDLLKENVRMQAKINIHTEVAAGDARTSQWYLERRDPEFREKQQIDTTVRLKDDAPDLAEAALKVL